MKSTVSQNSDVHDYVMRVMSCFDGIAHLPIGIVCHPEKKKKKENHVCDALAAYKASSEGWNLVYVEKENHVCELVAHLHSELSSHMNGPAWMGQIGDEGNSSCENATQIYYQLIHIIYY